MRGLLAEADAANARFIIPPLIEAQIAAGDLEGAMRTMASIDEVLHRRTLQNALLVKAVQDRGLDKTRQLVRQFVPDGTDRIGPYVAVLIQHARDGHAPQALDFLEDQLEVAPLHLKLDGYMGVAVAFHQAGQSDDARRVLSIAQQRVAQDRTPQNRIGMYAKVASGYAAIEDRDTARKLIGLAQQELDAAGPNATSRPRHLSQIGQAWASIDQIDQATQYLERIDRQDGLARHPLIDMIAQAHLRARQYEAVRQLTAAHHHPAEPTVDRAIVTAQLHHGEIDAVLATFSQLRPFDSNREVFARQIAGYLLRNGRHEQFDAWASSITDPRLKQAIHFGAARGLLDARRQTPHPPSP